MNTVENPIPHEENRPSLIIRRENNSFRITSPHVELAEDRAPLEFIVRVEKLPTRIEFGQRIEGVTIDNESQKLQQLRRQAAALRQLPERDRIIPLLDLVRGNIKYAFSDVIEELKESNPEKAKRVIQYTGLHNAATSVSEVVDTGYGICRHFSTTAISLGKDAGLQGSHLVHRGAKDDPQGSLKNVVRRDTGNLLFQSFPENELYPGGHTYVDFLMSDGEWIPTDPTTGLAGLTKEGQQTFKEANYRGVIDSSIKEAGIPRGSDGNVRYMYILPGEKTASGLFVVRRMRNFSPYHGPLDVTLSPIQAGTGTNIEIMSVLPSTERQLPSLKK